MSRRRNIQGALALFAMTALVFQGCGGVEEVRRAAGKGGGQASGGGSGTHAGTSGHSPSGGSSAGGSAGSAGTGGHSGHAGAGHGGDGHGGVANAGDGGVANGGDAGIANGGDGGALPFDVDPACHCQLSADDEFYCTVSPTEFLKRLPVPTDCENDLNQVTRAICDDGTTIYYWEEAGENAYTAQLDASGKLLYGDAMGYVGPLCGITPSGRYDFGSIEAGSYPDSTCSDQCSVCEGDSVGAGGASGGVAACPVCEPGPNGHVTVSLTEYCAYMGCPATLADARATIDAECANLVGADMTTSCGIVTVRSSTRDVGTSYFFDQASGTLVGVSAHNDEPHWGPCEALDYDVGTIPTACALESDCSLCAGSLDGAGGAGASELPACSAP
jgi:hypothetical protein